MTYKGLCNDLIITSCRFVKDHITELQELLSLDPFLVCALLYVCPRQELPLLCGYVSLGLMFGIMAYNIASNTASIHSWKQAEVSLNFSNDCIKNIDSFI